MDENGRLKINLLGKPEVWLGDQQLTSFSTAKTEALLYYLAATRQIYSRETLAGFLWEDMPESKARRNLTKSLTVLRRLLEPFLIIETQRVGFRPDMPFDLDVLALETADATVGASTDILSLYRGDFLEGFFVKDARPFEEWQLLERERLREGAINRLHDEIEQAIRHKDFSAGIALGRRLLQLDPLRESAHRQVMLLLARQGQYGAALSQYEQCRRILDDELGIEPVSETADLAQRIRAARDKTSFDLPHEPTPLIGRERELAQIQQRLQDPECRLLTITGLGGMGKTRLVIAAAHKINQQSNLLFLNGVAFVSLAGISSSDDVPLTLVNAMDVPLTSATTPTRALQHFLQSREMLLILDNLEHLPEVSELILTLLHTCADVKLLVTSRTPLNMASEWRLDLEGLPVPPEEETDVSTLQDFAAVTLFTRSASQISSTFELTAENGIQIGKLCRLVAGIPLALQLAATWLRAMSLSTIISELIRDLDILATDMVDIPPRQRSIRAVFESTWQMLSAEEKRAVETLSICRGGFTQEAASTFAKTSPFLLRRLINHRLISQQDDSRYDMHPLTRQFAREKLSTAGSAKAAETEHGHYYLTWLVQQVPALHGMKPRDAVQTIEKELDNLREAWEWAGRKREAAFLLDGLNSLAVFYDVLGLLQEGQDLAESALTYLGEAASSLEQELQCQAWTLKSHFMTEQGQYEAATKVNGDAEKLAKELKDDILLADIYHIQGRILNDTGQYTAAQQQYRRALSLLRPQNTGWKTAKTLIELGWTQFLDGEIEDALVSFEEALAIEQKAGHKKGEAYAMGNLAIVYSVKGDPRKALAHQEKVLTAYEELGDLLNLERAENNIGMTYLSMGDIPEALPHIQRAVELSRQIETRPGLTNALDTLATAYIAAGDYEKARACLDEALSSALDMGYMYMNYSVRALMVRLFNRTGELDKATAQLQQLRLLVERLENAKYIARSLVEQAQLTYAHGNLAEATEQITQAIDILRENPSPLDMPHLQLQYADYLLEQQRFAEARPLVEEAIQAARHFQHKPLQMRGSALAANLTIALGDIETAENHARSAGHLMAQLAPYPEVLQGLLHIGRYKQSSGDNQTAHKIWTFIANQPASPYIVRRHAEAFLEKSGPGAATHQIPLEWQELTRLVNGAQHIF